jgi:hypothetical protein
MWITTARFDDMHKQTVTYHPEQQVVAIKQQGDKTHVKSFIRIAPCSQEQFDRFWKPTIIIPEYPVFMNFLKLHTTTATAHSFRKGSIQHLQQKFNAQEDITLLSGHASKISAIQYYTNSEVHNRDFQVQLRMTTTSRNSIYPDGKY